MFGIGMLPQPYMETSGASSGAKITTGDPTGGVIGPATI